ncbi:hypothetical protein AB834_05385 [PVC group bacterium (ex Bugula neritina AB1)]|nr:hypothetical protein AB834_05385 [PVC group bacterium (ex Bugula neritina AB1)]
MDDFKGYLEKELELAPQTVATSIYSLKGAIRTLIERSSDLSLKQIFFIERKLKSIKPPRPATRVIPKEKILSEKEIQRLLDHLPRSVFSVCTLLKESGIRVSEALNLKWKDLKQHSNGATLEVMGKGDIFRTIRISFELLELLLHERETREVESDYIFATKSGKPLSRTNLHKTIHRYGKKILLKENVGCHTFRHSFATRLLKNGADVGSVSRYLGHASPATTLSFYCHNQLSDEQLFG